MSTPIRVLHIDLSKQVSKLKVHSDLEGFLGGVGVSTALLYEYFEEAGYPDHRNLAAPFAVAAGPFCDRFPGGHLAFTSFVSPLMRNLGQGYVAGSFGKYLKRNNVDALFVFGRSEKPSYLVIQDAEAKFKNANDLWGSDSTAALTKLKNAHPGSAQAVIGPAGERGGRFASVLTNDGGEFQRGGLGAVWGKKKLKAIVVGRGNSSDVSVDDACEDIRESMAVKLTDPRPESARFNLRAQNEKTWALEAEEGGLPSLNFSQVNESYESLRRSIFSDIKEKEGCRGCPVGCKDMVLYQGYRLQVSYECLVSLGPQLGIKDKENLYALLFSARKMGLDSVSLGVALAFLTEKNEWEFGDPEAYQALAKGITAREEGWAKELSLGILRAVTPESRDFAMALSGLEMEPYSNGYLSTLSQIVAAEDSFDYNLAHLLDFKELFGERAVEALIAEEKKGLVLASLAVCPLLRSVYDTSQIFSCLEALAWGWKHEDLEALGTKIYNLKWELKRKLGFSWEDVHLPQRLFAVPTATGYIEEDVLRGLIDIYKGKVESL